MSVNNGRSCKKRTLGDVCQSNSDCDEIIDKSICRQGLCICNLGYYKISSSSCQQFELGTPGCDIGDCSSVISHSTCVDDKCVCSYGYKSANDSCHCVDQRSNICVIVEIGVSNCTNDLFCKRYAANSFCSNSTKPHLCECLDGYAVTESSTKCEARGLNWSCTSNTDCVLINNATCSEERICTCDSPYVVFEDECIYESKY